MTKDFFVFDRKASYDFDCYCVANEVHQSPKKDFKKVTVPGRNGQLLVDNNRYDNSEISYVVFFYNPDHMEEHLSGLKAYLLSRRGYCRLEDTFHPDEFYHAIYSGNIEPEVLMNGAKMAKITLKFDRKPQKYLKQGELVKTITQNEVIFNPTYYAAQPLIRVYGYGVLTIGDYTVQIGKSSFPFIDIDCERMDAYYGTENCNNLIAVADFPQLVSGSSLITLPRNISKVEITPRWWTI